jgi:hypothetical protein
MTESFVIIHRSYDPVQADILGQLLRENGIYARVLGTRHGAVIGVSQNILQVHIEVPHSQAGEATDFLEDFFQTDGEQLLREYQDSLDQDEAQDQDDDQESARAGDSGQPDRPGLSIGRPLLAGALLLIVAGILSALFGSRVPQPDPASDPAPDRPTPDRPAPEPQPESFAPAY